MATPALDSRPRLEEHESISNWRAFLEGQAMQDIAEASLYTDAHIVGATAAIGPYTFISTRAHSAHPDALRAELVVRFSRHLADRARFETKAIGGGHYHGGDFLDELAAIVSLFLGVRVQAGGIERLFEPGGDPKGDPVRHHQRCVPALPMGPAQIPRNRGERAIGDIESARSIVEGSAEHTVALIKAARLYQQAVWVADADPTLAWLMLVGAVETVAETWDTAELPASERLQRWLPPLYDLLAQSAPDVLERAATILAKRTRAARKFIDFIVEFAPAAPATRPVEWLQFSFEEIAIKAAADKIYEHRSNALHGGVSFPLPMCVAPQRIRFSDRQDAAEQEIPFIQASTTRSASWPPSETPLLLHTFEYIARNAILQWWSSLNLHALPAHRAI